MRPLSSLITDAKDPPTLAHITSGVVVIDHHPLGFLQACYWSGEPRSDRVVPDGYKTARRGQSLDEFRDECTRKWPSAEVRRVSTN